MTLRPKSLAICGRGWKATRGLGRRSFRKLAFCWEKLSETFSIKTPLQTSPSNFSYEVLGCGGPCKLLSTSERATTTHNDIWCNIETSLVLSRFCIVKWKRGFRCSIWWSTRWGSQLSSSGLGRSLPNTGKEVTEKHINFFNRNVMAPALCKGSFWPSGVQGMVSIQNEIRSRSERDTNLHNLRPLRDKTGKHTRIFLIGVPVSWNCETPRKKDTWKTTSAWI